MDPKVCVPFFCWKNMGGLSIKNKLLFIINKKTKVNLWLDTIERGVLALI